VITDESIFIDPHVLAGVTVDLLFHDAIPRTDGCHIGSNVSGLAARTMVTFASNVPSA
jgi:hypothetical protein